MFVSKHACFRRLNSSGGSDSLEHGTNWIKSQCKAVGKIYVADTYAQDLQYDHRPESLISVTGGEVGKFVSLLVSAKDIIPTGGPLNNVPPTIIAPNGFTNGTLQRLKVRYVFQEFMNSINRIFLHIAVSVLSLGQHDAYRDFGWSCYASCNPFVGSSSCEGSGRI